MATGYILCRDSDGSEIELRPEVHIGSGSNSAVVRCFKVSEPSRQFAIKILDPRKAEKIDVERETRMFNHPNLIRIYDCTHLADMGFFEVPDWVKDVLNCDIAQGTQHKISECHLYSNEVDHWRMGVNKELLDRFYLDDYYLVRMELCPRYLKLSAIVGQSQKLIIELLDGICRGVSVMHSEGILHLDLRAENIFLDLEGKPKIADFGLSKEIEEPGYDINLSPELIPPSLVPGEEDFKTDIYQLGLLSFKLLTGKDLPDVHYSTSEIMSDFRCFGFNAPRTAIEACLRARDEDFSSVEEFHTALLK